MSGQQEIISLGIKGWETKLEKHNGHFKEQLNNSNGNDCATSLWHYLKHLKETGDLQTRGIK